MRRLSLVAAVAVALAAAPAAAAPPANGVVVPGRTLGGLALGATKQQVERAWGRAYGVCKGCARETWYFNFFAFQPQGAGVEFRDGRAAALFTLWAPAGWRTARGLAIGDHESLVTDRHGALTRRDCEGYYVLTDRARDTVTAVYVSGGEVWAFALLRPGVRICR